MKIIIVGAGIGGLTAALCLQKAAYQVTVLEKSQQPQVAGAGIQLSANALKVFQHLGLMEALKQHIVAPEQVSFRDYKSAKVLHQIKLGNHYQQRFGAPYWHIHRADLHRVLLEELERRQPNAVQYGKIVESAENTQQGVDVSLHGGESMQADLLIAADGVRSNIRRHIFGEPPANFTGYVAWRLVVNANRLPENFMPTEVANFVGPKQHAVIYYLKNKSLVNLVGVVENKQWRSRSWTEKAPWQELKNDFKGWHSTVQQVIDAGENQACFRWALCDTKPMTSWSEGNITLLGDAAHASLPFMASGASMAIEDARILDRCLQQPSTFDDALLSYQNNRMARTAQVQKQSRTLGSLYHLNNSLARNTAFKMLSLVPNKQDFLPNYDANTIELV